MLTLNINVSQAYRRKWVIIGAKILANGGRGRRQLKFPGKLFQHSGKNFDYSPPQGP